MAVRELTTSNILGLPAPASGLTLVKTQVIGSAVSSVVVSDAFSATYDNYAIKVTGGAASVSLTQFTFQLAGITTGLYFSGASYGTYSGTTQLYRAQSGGTSFSWAGNGSSAVLYADITIAAPFLTRFKSFTAVMAEHDSGEMQSTSRGIVFSTASSTGFTLGVTYGTITGGTIRVYGYQN